MKINQLKSALASGITAAIVWSVCSVLVWMVPGGMMTTTANMVHMEMNRGGWILTPTGVVWGLVAWTVFAGIVGWLLSTVYNLLNRN